MGSSEPTQLIVVDIDNTLFDWVRYYAHSFLQLLKALQEVTHIPVEQLAYEAKEVFSEENSIEYPFVIQKLPSVIAHYERDWDLLISEAVTLGRRAFVQSAEDVLKPYDGVVNTLATLKATFGHIPLVALTDAPRYVAMWKLNKLGILSYFDAVYGLMDPDLPVSPDHKRILVDERILLKHHLRENFGFSGKIRILPEEYEKPGIRGLRTVMMDYEFDRGITRANNILWVGDNLAKDVHLGRTVGVTTAWAKYGTHIDAEAKKVLLTFSPEINIKKHMSLDPQSATSPRADHEFMSFSDILAVIIK